jgi:hypothetical protein
MPPVDGRVVREVADLIRNQLAKDLDLSEAVLYETSHQVGNVSYPFIRLVLTRSVVDAISFDEVTEQITLDVQGKEVVFVVKPYIGFDVDLDDPPEHMMEVLPVILKKRPFIQDWPYVRDAVDVEKGSDSMRQVFVCSLPKQTLFRVSSQTSSELLRVLFKSQGTELHLEQKETGVGSQIMSILARESIATARSHIYLYNLSADHDIPTLWAQLLRDWKGVSSVTLVDERKGYYSKAVRSGKDVFIVEDGKVSAERYRSMKLTCNMIGLVLGPRSYPDFSKSSELMDFLEGCKVEGIHLIVPSALPTPPGEIAVDDDTADGLMLRLAILAMTRWLRLELVMHMCTHNATDASFEAVNMPVMQHALSCMLHSSPEMFVRHAGETLALEFLSRHYVSDVDYDHVLAQLIRYHVGVTSLESLLSGPLQLIAANNEDAMLMLDASKGTLRPHVNKAMSILANHLHDEVVRPVIDFDATAVSRSETLGRFLEYLRAKHLNEFDMEQVAKESLEDLEKEQAVPLLSEGCGCPLSLQARAPVLSDNHSDFMHHVLRKHVDAKVAYETRGDFSSFGFRPFQPFAGISIPLTSTCGDLIFSRYVDMDYVRMAAKAYEESYGRGLNLRKVTVVTTEG